MLREILDFLFYLIMGFFIVITMALNIDKLHSTLGQIIYAIGGALLSLFVSMWSFLKNNNQSQGGAT